MNESNVAAYMRNAGIQGRILPLKISTETVEAAAAALNVPTDCIVKSLLFLIAGEPILVIACGRQRIDRRALASHFGVGRTHIELAEAEIVMALTGYEVGAVPPFGHQRKLSVIMDRDVLAHRVVYAGGGTRDSLLEITPQEILRITGATILDLQMRDGETG